METLICCVYDCFARIFFSLVPQGPCTGNQQSLAHSRLWDAVVGFLHVFAHMQMKLSQVNELSATAVLTNKLDTEITNKLKMLS